MCTYVTEQTSASGSSGKGARGWFPLSAVTVYYDHPVHAGAEHTLNLDFANPERGAAERVAVELTTETAIGVVQAIAGVLAQVPADLSGVDPEAAARLRAAAQACAPPDAMDWSSRWDARRTAYVERRRTPLPELDQ